MLSDKELTQFAIRKAHKLDYDLSDQMYTLQEIGELLPGNLVLNNLKSGHNLFMNNRGCHTLGYEREELQMMKDDYLQKFFHPDDIADLFRQWHAFMEAPDSERVIGFFQRVKTHRSDHWEWYFTTAKFRKDDLSQTIFLAHSIRQLPQLVSRFERVIEEEVFYKKHYSRFDTLTKREKEILKAIALGETSKSIAERLHISQLTVDTHRKHIIQKLDTKCLPELIKYASVFRLIA